MENNHNHQVAIVPSPGMGHVIPLASFAKLLVSRHHHLSVSLLLPAGPGPALLGLLRSLPDSISCTFLPPRDRGPSIKTELARTRPVALVVDLMGGELFDLGKEVGVPTYLFFTTTAMGLSFAFHLPKLHETVSCEYRDMPDPFVLPGCVPLHGRDFPVEAQDRKAIAYKMMIYHMKKFSLAQGIFINTFFQLEPNVIRALVSEDPNRPPVYPIGPIIRLNSGLDNGLSKPECLIWLDRQPSRSVLLVSFGSAGLLSYEQTNELAIGLEKSGLRFLWVVRRPNNEALVEVKSENNELGFLPDGFINRIKDRGLLIPSWAPQVAILAHESIGGFITHCGWNSILESIYYAVPLIAWPLYAEQRMNAILLNEVLRVALLAQESENGIVEAETIVKVTKQLVEGEEGKRIRKKMEELSNVSKNTMSENGESIKLLDQVVLNWKSKDEKTSRITKN